MDYRFKFGRNWRRFLRVLDAERIAAAEESLRTHLGVRNLDGKRFLDIGSGSGLFSLAARRLGATVYSFDFDPDSVSCTEALRTAYFPSDDRWMVSRGSVLDKSYLDQLGQFDIVYSWGVLHHTGAMWQALDNAAHLVGPHGVLFISIYNDEGSKSRRWRTLKRVYNRSWLPVKAIIFAGYVTRYAVGRASWVVKTLRQGKIPTFEKRPRGMTFLYDVIDWIGGYPFEVATPEAISRFYADRGFRLATLVRRNGSGCNEFVLERRIVTDANRGAAER